MYAGFFLAFLDLFEKIKNVILYQHVNSVVIYKKKFFSINSLISLKLQVKTNVMMKKLSFKCRLKNYNYIMLNKIQSCWYSIINDVICVHGYHVLLQNENETSLILHQNLTLIYINVLIVSLSLSLVFINYELSILINN